MLVAVGMVPEVWLKILAGWTNKKVGISQWDNLAHLVSTVLISLRYIQVLYKSTLKCGHLLQNQDTLGCTNGIWQGLFVWYGLLWCHTHN